MYILDSELNPVPIGVEGELYVGGIGLARGYLNRPELTSERFVKNPFASYEDIANGYDKLYKTGDIVRWLPDGNIEYIGRNDFQVKIRGFRVELEEIENQLASIKGISQASVLANYNEDTSSYYLIGYYVVNNEISINQEAILTELRNILPDYMVPNILVKVDYMPLTSNGKLDRKALPTPQFAQSNNYVPPTTHVEIALCSIIADVLKLEKVGINDDFFMMGGNSILAIRIVSEFNKINQGKISVLNLLKQKTVHKIVENIREESPSDLADFNLSDIHHMEKNILYHQVVTGNELIYSESIVIEFEQNFSFDRFRFASESIYKNMDIFRSNYIKVGDEFTRIISTVEPSSLLCEQIFVKDDDESQFQVMQLEKIKFDIAKDILIRFYLINIGKDKQLILIKAHHLVMDATTNINILIPELYGLLFDKDFEQNKYSIEDFQRVSHSIYNTYSTNFSEKADYWKNELLSVTPMSVADKNGDASNYNGGQLTYVFGKDVHTKISGIAINLQESVFAILYSIFSLVLLRISGNDKIAIKTNIDERIYHDTDKNVPGCLINNVFIMSNFTSGQSLKGFIHENAKRDIRQYFKCN